MVKAAARGSRSAAILFDIWSPSEVLPLPDLPHAVPVIRADETGRNLSSQTAQRAKSALTAGFWVLSDAGKLVGVNASGLATVGGSAASGRGRGVGTGASQWQNTGVTVVDGVIHDVYHNIAQGVNAAADLLIQHGITVI